MNVLGVDVGGTFTDAVLLADGELRTAKVPTARRQEESVLAAAHAVGAEGVERFTHGTTVATNALLERKGARTAFVATAGFEHMLHLRRQNRAQLYRLCAAHPDRSSRWNAASAYGSGSGPTACSSRWSSGRYRARGRRRGGRGLPAVRVPRRVARARGRRGAAAAAPWAAHRRVARWRRSSASTSGPRRLRSTRTWGRLSRGTWKGFGLPVPRPACRSRS